MIPKQPTYQFVGKSVDKPTERFLDIFVQLNKAMLSGKSPHQGNLYYFGHGRIEDLAPIHKSEITSDILAPKRHNFRNAVIGKRIMLEIGFNAGHSALLALEANPALRYIGIDIGRTDYTRICADILNAHYSDRFELIIGSSLDEFPKMFFHKYCSDIDLIHIDGGHAEDIVIEDTANALRMPKRKGIQRHLLFDDTRIPWVRDLVFFHIAQGNIRTESLGGSWKGEGNLLFEVIS